MKVIFNFSNFKLQLLLHSWVKKYLNNFSTKFNHWVGNTEEPQWETLQKWYRIKNFKEEKEIRLEIKKISQILWIVIETLSKKLYLWNRPWFLPPEILILSLAILNILNSILCAVEKLFRLIIIFTVAQHPMRSA